MLAGSARILSSCAVGGTACQRVALGRLGLPPHSRSLPGSGHPKGRLSCAASAEEPSVRPDVDTPDSRTNGDPGATTSGNSSSAAAANGPAGALASAHGKTEEQLLALRSDLQKLRLALGTQSAASQQQFLSINSLERQAQGRTAAPQPRTHLAQGPCSVLSAAALSICYFLRGGSSTWPQRCWRHRSN